MPVYGLDQVKPLILNGKIEFVLYSFNLGSSSRRTLDWLKISSPGLTIYQIPENESMSELLGIDKVKVAGFKKSPLTDRISEIAATVWSTDGKKI